MPRKAQLKSHQTSDELDAGYRRAKEAQEARRWRLILLISQGKTIKEASEISDINYAHAQDILKRYNAYGPDALKDGRKKPRKRGPAKHALLDVTQRRELTAALQGPAPDGGVWTGPKVARWIEEMTGRDKVGNQRGWDYLRRLGNPANRRTRTPAVAAPAPRGRSSQA